MVLPCSSLDEGVGGLFVGCGMGCGGSMIFSFSGGGGIGKGVFVIIGEEVEMEVGGCKILVLGILHELLRNHLPPESHESVAMTPQLGVV